MRRCQLLKSNGEISEGKGMNTVNVLVVKSDVDAAETMKKTIQGLGHKAEISTTGNGALEKVRQTEFDLVLIDIFLPDGKGHHLIPKFKELRPNIGIVTMTHDNTRELELEARNQGIIFYMIEPGETYAVKDVIDHVYKKKQNGKEVKKT